VVEDAIAYGETVGFLLHEIVLRPADVQYNEDDLRAILDHVATRPIQVTTMTAALRRSTSANLVGNSSFTRLVDGWAAGWQRSDSAGITVDQGAHGNAPGAARSVRIVGGATQRELTSDAIPVRGTARYIVRLFQSVQDLAAGGWAVWIEERDSRNTWLSGQWLGGNWDDLVGIGYYEYTPSSTSVSRVQITIYTEPGSQLTLFVDSVELREVT
jgi:hypothetical protein